MSQVVGKCIFEQVPESCSFFKLDSIYKDPHGGCTAPRGHPLVACLINKRALALPNLALKLTEPGKEHLRELLEELMEQL